MKQNNIVNTISWKDSKWLVLSSFAFLIPSVYAFVFKLYFYFFLLLFTSLVSANYWRKANYSWRRNMDLIVAKVSFIIFFYNGIFYVRYLPYMIIGYPLLVILIYFYYKSGKLLQMKNENWYTYHFLFHITTMCVQMIIIDSIKQPSLIFNNPHLYSTTITYIQQPGLSNFYFILY
jgi:hypothetical protein